MTIFDRSSVCFKVIWSHCQPFFWGVKFSWLIFSPWKKVKIKASNDLLHVTESLGEKWQPQVVGFWVAFVGNAYRSYVFFLKWTCDSCENRKIPGSNG